MSAPYLLCGSVHEEGTSRSAQGCGIRPISSAHEGGGELIGQGIWVWGASDL